MDRHSLGLNLSTINFKMLLIGLPIHFFLTVVEKKRYFNVK